MIHDCTYIAWHITANQQQRERAALRRLVEYSIPYVLRSSQSLPYHVEVRVPFTHASRAVQVLERDFGRRN